MFRHILFVSILAFCTSAFAQITTLQVVGKEHYKGQNRVRLHALANQQLTAQGQNPSDFELVGVTIRAKSKRGRGQATLIVGQDQETKDVDDFGNKLLFDVTAPWAYHTLNWDLSDSPGSDAERWQMLFEGNIKVREIRLHVQPVIERVRIPYNDQLFAGNNTLFLKRELQQMGYDVRGAELSRVVLVAKSRAGRGQATLVAGRKFASTKVVEQAQGGLDFQSDRPVSYNRIRWNPNVDVRGAWQIELNGRIKVKAVIVEFK